MDERIRGKEKENEEQKKKKREVVFCYILAFDFRVEVVVKYKRFAT